jgi:hypothetical protein
MAQRVGRGIALLFHDRGTRRGEWSATRPSRTLPPGKDSVPIVQGAGWAPGPVWTGGKSRPIGIRSPDQPARHTLSQNYNFHYRKAVLLTTEFQIIFVTLLE